MFLVVPLVEFLHVLGADINVHHENPATFLCHVSVSSVKRSCQCFSSSRWAPSPHAWSPRETRAILGLTLPRLSNDWMSAWFGGLLVPRSRIPSIPAGMTTRFMTAFGRDS